MAISGVTRRRRRATERQVTASSNVNRHAINKTGGKSGKAILIFSPRSKGCRLYAVARDTFLTLHIDENDRRPNALCVHVKHANK